MKTSLGLLALLLLPFVAACDEKEEPQPLTIVDKSAEEAADLTTDVACDYVARCGVIEMSCADCANGQDCGGCTVEQVPVPHEECAEELGPELTAAFSCQELTAEEQALVDECLAALPSAECPTIETVEDGDEEAETPSELAACDVLEELMERCYEQSEPEDELPPEPREG